MIRYGMVHESPGYVCPYYVDREHKYPRPDNLQRLVPFHAANVINAYVGMCEFTILTRRVIRSLWKS
jgi:hypothetical protein